MAELNKIPVIRFKGFSEVWEEKQIADLCSETTGGGTPKTTESKYWNGDIPWLQSSDLVENQLSNVVYRKTITDNGLKSSATKLVPADSIAIITRVGVGKLALIPYEYSTSQDFLSLSYLKIDKWFGAYSIWKKIQSELHAVQGTSIKGITKEELLSKRALIAKETDEQTQIGSYFQHLDKLISLHQTKVNKLTNLKKAMLEKMFPKQGADVPEIRFKGFAGAWEIKSLADICDDTFGGGTPKTSQETYWDGDTPWIQSSDLIEGDLTNVAPKKYVTHAGIKGSATKLIPKNSIAIVTRVGIGKLALIPFTYTTSQDFLSLSRLKIDKEFAVYAIWKKIQEDLHIVQGTSIKGITKEEALTKVIKVPTGIDEQQKIGAYFQNLDKTITLHQTELEKITNLKKACLEKMFV